MSKKKRPEHPAMLLAWMDWVHTIEETIRVHKKVLKESCRLAEARDSQRKLKKLAKLASVMYALRHDSKLISFYRWGKRHELFPDRLPICGTPSRHPDLCVCNQEGRA